MNFDRLYFAKQISLTLLGVYGIAKSMADMLTNLVIRSSNMVLFPAVAAMEASPAQVRARLLHARRTMLLLVAGGLAAFVAISDIIVNLLYDDRYAQAAVFLPLLLLGVWVSLLATVKSAAPAMDAASNSTAVNMGRCIRGAPRLFLGVLILRRGRVVQP